MRSIEIGDFRITHIRAGSYWWDGGAMFGVVPKTLWSKFLPNDELNRIEAGFNCYVIEDGHTRILVETGGGVRHDARALHRMRMPEAVRLPEALSAQGFQPESIDTVINTHLHWDHAGGNTLDVGGCVLPALPEARYITQRAELMHAREQHPRDAISYRAVNYEPLLEAGRMHLLDGDGEIAPGVEVRVTPGHNRDMMIVLVRSQGKTWCHLADLVMYAAQITPTWVSGFDLFPLEGIDNKARLLGQAAREDWVCSFAHDPDVGFGKIEVQEGKWRLRQNRS
ncbi:MAG TPA: MBL fold metallo-hydrolase [Bryobacteraceae bacterium]|nr:MBL fold metallo-hydrolase [Bryobacteraceae bacterium]